MRKTIAVAILFSVLTVAGNVVAGEKLAMGTGGAAGVYYPLGGAMAQLIADKNPGIEISVQVTGATGENLPLIEARGIDFAIVQNDLTHAAYNALAPYTSGMSNLRAVARLYPEYLHVVASVPSGIKTMHEFKDRRVSVGARGSGNEANCRQIFEFYGLNYENLLPVFLPYAETADRFKERLVDAFVFTIGTPNPAIQDIASTLDLRFVPVDGAERDAIVARFPYFTKDQLPANSYKGQTEPVETLSVQAMLIVNKDVPDDTVYAVAKTIFDNLEALTAAHSQAAFFDAGKCADGVTIPFHPGAERYFREKGVMK